MEPAAILARMQRGAFTFVPDGRTRSGIAQLTDGPRVICAMTPFGGPPAPDGVLDLIQLSGPWITPMVGVVQTAHGVVLAEVEPPGMCLDLVLDDGPLPVPDAVAVAAALADTLAHVHRRGQTVWAAFLDPELVYVADGRLTGLAPRGPVAVSRAANNPRGMYNPPPPPPVHLISPAAARGQPTSPADEVFTLCACLHWWATGDSLYGDADNVFAILQQVITGARVATRKLPPAVAAIVDAGTVADPAARPTAAELRDRLRALG